MAGNITVYTPSHGPNRKYFLKLQHQSQNATLREIHNFSVHLFRHKKRLLNFLIENGPNYLIRDGYQSVYSRADILFTF